MLVMRLSRSGGRSWIRSSSSHSDPQRRASWLARRFSTMNQPMRLGIAAIVVVVAALIGFSYLSGLNVGAPQETPSPSSPSSPSSGSSPSTSASPRDLPGAEAALQPGTYLVDGPFRIPLTVTTTAGWVGYVGEYGYF